MDEQDRYWPQTSDSAKSSAATKQHVATSQARPGQAQDRPSWISAQADQIFGAYRRDQFADPDSFVLQLCMVLERYSDAIVREVASPLTGIQRKVQFPPTIAEVVEFCDNEQARIERVKRYGDMRTHRADLRPKQHLANVLVRPGFEQYGKLVERAEKSPANQWKVDEEGRGIWVPLGWIDDLQKMPFKLYTAEQLEAIYNGGERAAE